MMEEQLFMTNEHSDLPFTIGPRQMATGFKRLSLRQEVRAFVWPSNDATRSRVGARLFLPRRALG